MLLAEKTTSNNVAVEIDKLHDPVDLFKNEMPICCLCTWHPKNPPHHKTTKSKHNKNVTTMWKKDVNLSQWVQKILWREY